MEDLDENLKSFHRPPQGRLPLQLPKELMSQVFIIPTPLTFNEIIYEKRFPTTQNPQNLTDNREKFLPQETAVWHVAV